MLEAGTNLTLLVLFKNTLSSDLSGMYKSEYKATNEDKLKKVACTFFSPISARKAFPCFDEPVFKVLSTHLTWTSILVGLLVVKTCILYRKLAFSGDVPYTSRNRIRSEAQKF